MLSFLFGVLAWLGLGWMGCLPAVVFGHRAGRMRLARVGLALGYLNLVANLMFVMDVVALGR
ncbi:MAG: hypothetical protein AAFV29_03810 [Myxococcota bacterium]